MSAKEKQAPFAPEDFEGYMEGLSSDKKALKEFYDSAVSGTLTHEGMEKAAKSIRQLRGKIHDGKAHMQNPEDFAIYYEYGKIEESWIKPLEKRI